MKKCLPILTFVLLMTFSIGAYAQSFSENQLQAFLSTVPQIKSLSNEMNKKGKGQFIKNNMGIVGTNGFAPYSSVVSLLKKEFPGHYQRLASTVAKAGFTSVAQWSSTGDAILAAHMSNRVLPGSKDALTPIEKITPESLATMSAQGRARIKTTQDTVKLLRNISDEDRRLAAKYRPQIDQAIR